MRRSWVLLVSGQWLLLFTCFSYEGLYLVCCSLYQNLQLYRPLSLYRCGVSGYFIDSAPPFKCGSINGVCWRVVCCLRIFSYCPFSLYRCGGSGYFSFLRTGCVSILAFHMFLYDWSSLASCLMQNISESVSESCVISRFPSTDAEFLDAPWVSILALHMRLYYT